MDPDLEVQNPQTTAERLAQIAAERPDLAAWIGAHPNAYPELREWAAQVSAQSATQGSIATTIEAGYQQSGVGGAPTQAPQPGATAGYPPAFGAEGVVKPKSKTGLIIGVLIGAVVIVGTMVALFVSGVFSSGARSPQAAAEQVLTSAAQGDFVGLAKVMSLAEVTTFTEAFERGADGIESANTDTTAYARDLQAVLRAAKIRYQDLTFEEIEIAQDITRVVITGGTATMEGDPEAIGSAVGDFVERSLATGDDLDASEIADAKAQAEIEVVEALSAAGTDLTFDFASTTSSGLPGLSMLTVKEGSSWYVSPVMTLADYAYQVANMQDNLPLGTRVVEPVSSKTPDQSMEVFVASLFQEDIDTIASTLPLAERRLLSIYGPALREALGSSSSGILEGSGLVVDAQAYGATVDGDWAVLNPQDLVLNYSGETLILSGDCVTVSGQTSCLSEVEGLSELDLSEGMFVAVRENGSWYASPTATIGYLFGKMIASGDFAQTATGFDWGGTPFTPTSPIAPTTPGGQSGLSSQDDAKLLELSEKCFAGDMIACDDLYFEAPFDSVYEEIGDTCGFTKESGGYCSDNS